MMATWRAARAFCARSPAPDVTEVVFFAFIQTSPPRSRGYAAPSKMVQTPIKLRLKQQA
jgi:hypothetical protein